MTEPLIRCLWTSTINSRACMTWRKYYTWYLRWQTTTFEIYIFIISLNMKRTISLTLIMMKIIGDWIVSRQMQVPRERGMQGSRQRETQIRRQEGMRVIKRNLALVFVVWYFKSRCWCICSLKVVLEESFQLQMGFSFTFLHAKGLCTSLLITRTLSF